MNNVGLMGNLAAFLNPDKASISSQPSILDRIVTACDNLNLPAPLKAVSGVLREKLGGGKGKSVAQLDWNDLRDMSGSLIKNSPPSVVGRAMELNALDYRQVSEIAGEGQQSHGGHNQGHGQGGMTNNPFFQGIVSHC